MKSVPAPAPAPEIASADNEGNEEELNGVMKKLSIAGTVTAPKVIFTTPIERNEEEDQLEEDYYSEEEDVEEVPQVQEEATYELENESEFPALGFGSADVEADTNNSDPDSMSSPVPVSSASGMSWADVGKSEAIDESCGKTVPVQAKTVETTVIPANKNAIIAAEASLQPLSPTKAATSSASGSRIIVSAAHTSSYSSVIAPETAAAEDDGEGWANPFNIKSLKANGQVHNMVQVSASAVISTSSTGKKSKKNKKPVRTDTSMAGDGDISTAKSPENEDVTLHEKCDHIETDAGLDDNEGFEVVTKKKTVKKTQNTKNKNFRKNNKNVSLETSMSRVGCVTTDFTMQNVMMQIGLKIISVSDGMQIHNITHYVLRCAACYTIHYDMSKLFCSKCGK